MTELSVSGVRNSLAVRLRGLRRARRITQQQVAEALSQDEPIGVSTLSTWENTNKPVLPPPSRIPSLARFYAQPADDAAADPMAVEKLERELLRLRTQDAGEEFVPQFWRFDDGAPITIICSDLEASDEVQLSELSNEDNPNYTGLLSFADLDALVDLLMHLSVLNPEADITYRKATDASELGSHLVLLGGIAWNDVTRHLNARVDLPIRQRADERISSGEIFTVERGPEQGRKLEALWENDDPGSSGKPGHLLEDVAMFARTPNPFNSQRTLTYCNGIHSRGVLGAVRSLTDPQVREHNERFLFEHFATAKRFVIMARVPVLGRRTISPDFSNPDAVLYSWSDPEAPRSEA